MNLLALVVLSLFAGCGGGGENTTLLTCFNNGNGTQECVDGSGNVTHSNCVIVNGTPVTSTGQPCDASTTTVNPTPTETPVTP